MITTITALPPVPSRSDPATFSEKADTLIGAMPTMVSQLNNFAAEVNTLSFKTACKVATTTNLANLVRPVTIDGQIINAGDRVLVKDQSNTAQNGIYIAAGDNIVWTRAADMDTVEEVAGSFVPVTYGVTNGGKIFYTTFNATGSTLNTTAIPWNSLTNSTFNVTGPGVLGVANGGTNISSYGVGDLIYSTASTTLEKLAAAASGNVLKSGTAPSWGKVALASDVSGTLPVANGGTGLNSVGASFGLYLTSNGTGGWAAATLPGASTTTSGTTQFATDAELDTNQAPVSNRSVTLAGLRNYGTLKSPSTLAAGSLSGTNYFIYPPATWVKRITISLSGVSTVAADSLLVQLGTSTGFLTTGYVSDSAGTNGTGGAGGWVTATNGFIIRQEGAIGSSSGHILLTHVNENVWVSSHTVATENSGVVCIGGGSIALPGQLDRVRLITAGGTTTFDSGWISFLYD